MNERVNVHYAKTHLSALLRKVRDGQTVIIANAGTPVARLVPMEHGKRRAPGGFAFNAGKEFLKPLPKAELDAWEK